jgi:cell division protein FtsL
MSPRRLKGDKRWALIKLFFWIYVCAGIFTVIWLTTHVVKLEYELGQLSKKKLELLEENQNLSAERARLYSASNIEKIAVKKLGMTYPDRKNFFFVKRFPEAAPYKVSVKQAYKKADKSRWTGRGK